MQTIFLGALINLGPDPCGELGTVGGSDTWTVTTRHNKVKLPVVHTACCLGFSSNRLWALVVPSPLEFLPATYVDELVLC